MAQSNPLPLVLVEWVDSHGSGSWMHQEDINPEPMLCLSAGWLYAESATGVVILPHISAPEENTTPQVNGHMVIPRVAITRIVRLKEGARYSKRGG